MNLGLLIENVANLLNFKEKETGCLLFWSIFTAIKRGNII